MEKPDLEQLSLEEQKNYLLKLQGPFHAGYEVTLTPNETALYVHASRPGTRMSDDLATQKMCAYFRAYSDGKITLKPYQKN